MQPTDREHRSPFARSLTLRQFCAAVCLTECDPLWVARTCDRAGPSAHPSSVPRFLHRSHCRVKVDRKADIFLIKWKATRGFLSRHIYDGYTSSARNSTLLLSVLVTGRRLSPRGCNRITSDTRDLTLPEKERERNAAANDRSKCS